MNNSAFTFQTLHPDTIMDALFEQGIRVDSGLTPLNSYENRVYQFQDEDRRRFVVKFYRPERWTADQILEEHQFALQLVNDEVPVAAPVAFNGQTLLNHQGFYFAVFPSVGGRQFEADNIDQMEAVGRYLGRMHQTGRKQLFIQSGFAPGIDNQPFFLHAGKTPDIFFHAESVRCSSILLFSSVRSFCHLPLPGCLPQQHGRCHGGTDIPAQTEEGEEKIFPFLVQYLKKAFLQRLKGSVANQISAAHSAISCPFSAYPRSPSRFRY